MRDSINNRKRITAIIPAYNEEARISAVLQAVTRAELVDEVLVVSDGSTDRTFETALCFPGVQAIRLETNQGKAAAMTAGALYTDADLLVFLDADLVGLKPQHVDKLVRPVLLDWADMSIGVFKGGRLLTDLAQKIAPVISGQRAITRDLFLSAGDISTLGMGIELALTLWAIEEELRVCNVVIDGVTHVMKEEKLGPWKGSRARLRMYCDIARVMGAGRQKRAELARARRAAAED